MTSSDNRSNAYRLHILGLLFVALSGSALADFFQVGNDQIYDSVLGTTWLKNADLPASKPFGVAGITANGQMSWNSAQNWISAMNSAKYFGYSDWGLPTTKQPDGTCSAQAVGVSFGTGCTGSQMGNLFYSGLGGAAGQSIANNHNSNYGIFAQIQSDSYWSGNTSSWGGGVGAYLFDFANGFQDLNTVTADKLYAWAIHPDSTVQPPTVLTLAKLANDVYGPNQGAENYLPVKELSQSNAMTGFAANVYKYGNQIVVGVRGTNPNDEKDLAYNLLSDTSFETGIANQTLKQSVAQLASIVSDAHKMDPSAEITLTGHSLGGAVAELVGHAAGIRVVGFDAPGPRSLETAVAPELTPLAGANIPSSDSTISNYRLYGDQVSLVGEQLGSTTTVGTPKNLSVIDVVGGLLSNHSIDNLVSALSSGGPQQNGKVGLDLVPLLEFAVASATKVQEFIQKFFIDVLTAAFQYLIDPPAGSGYLLKAGADSSDFSSIALPLLGDVSAWYLQFHDELGWSGLNLLSTSDGFDFGPGVDAIQFWPLDSLLDPTFNQDPFAFGLTFASSGVFDGTVTSDQNFTGTITPFTNSTPEPGTLLLTLLPLAWLLYRSSRRTVSTRAY